MAIAHFAEKYFFFLILGVVLGGAGLAWYAAVLRRRKLGELAASMGLLFSQEGPDYGLLEATGLGIFRIGRSRSAENLIRVQAPAGNISVFDYSYVTGSGKNSQTHVFTLALIERAGMQLPDFELKPENLLYKFGELIGFKDIDLPGFPVFSDKYRLTGADESAVLAFFGPERAAWFERNLGLYVQGCRSFAVLFKKEGRLSVDAWPAFMEEAKVFAAEALR